MSRIVCIYNYYERDANYKNNLKYFLKHGINDASDYLFVVNGSCTAQFPSRHNIKPVIHRPNIGYDFQAHVEAIRSLDLDSYDYFVFINSSVMGPCNNGLLLPWQRSFTDMIRDDTKLVGSTINIYRPRSPKHALIVRGFLQPYSHVQTQVFAMDRECLLFLKDKVFIDHDPNDSFDDIIHKKEVSMSQYVLKNGWNINCLAPGYKGLDYRIVGTDINPTSRNGDANFEGAYFGRSLLPREILFVKTNRNYVITSEERFETHDVGGAWRFCTISLCIVLAFVSLAAVFLLVHAISPKRLWVPYIFVRGLQKHPMRLSSPLA